MKASECSFTKMLETACYIPDLAMATSFLQVEYGLPDLEACWDGFVHTSDNYNQNFSTKTQICLEFTSALQEYLKFIQEKESGSIGLQ
jgi:hypothetical protein